MSTDLQPTVADVLQEEDTSAVTVPVCITDQRSPVRTQELPRKGGATFTRPLTTTPLHILRADHRRARAVLLCDAVIYVAFSQASAQDTTSMTKWLANVPFPCDATTDVYVRTATGTADLGVVTYLWAEG